MMLSVIVTISILFTHFLFPPCAPSPLCRSSRLEANELSVVESLKLRVDVYSLPSESPKIAAITLLDISGIIQLQCFVE